MRRVVLRSHGRLASLGWLGLAFLFGFPFIAVGLEPGGKAVNLLIGIPVFGLLVGLALWDLGRSDVLVLDVGARRGRFQTGRYHRTAEVDFAFEDVARLMLVTSTVVTGGRHPSAAIYRDLRLELRDGRSVTLPLGRRHDADDLAVRAGRALGLRVDRQTLAGPAP